MRFVRKTEVMKLSGFEPWMLWRSIKAGEFPPPDAYIGPRSPVWKDETIWAWQQARLAAPKQPAEAPRRRRRRETEQQTAA